MGNCFSTASPSPGPGPSPGIPRQPGDTQLGGIVNPHNPILPPFPTPGPTLPGDPHGARPLPDPTESTPSSVKVNFQRSMLIDRMI